MHELPGGPQRIADLLPGPPLTAGDRDLMCLDALGDSVQRHRGTQSLGQILGSDRHGDPFDVHAVSLD